ncbi:single-stranded DNA-binding protein [Streptosporangium sp. NBC_01755]|uniref:single-stranded DNA-binding protein n=1 Tax=unclassified Streptosporangium TaxID=2632669 RepID=UPI002DD8A9DC|nr:MULTISPECIES: single-stranded DNA-binding protein [unclassified Streptosporangium]WSA26990.1 single-stranded DNA-binding protein [Streptosporangium sp. NBC_01810]WSD01598.1 single-stranded DNA-binding protein [Streptosporangium sp. NBC_01755]
MNDIHVTLTGNVAATPRQHTFPDGSRVTSLKIASTSRYFDRENQQWRNGETTYFGVRCFRGLADNVAQSVQLGQPVVVQGRLRIREFTHEGERRFMPEVEANSLGHDLRWGLGSFSKPQRGGPVAALGSAERSELDRETSDWAMSGGAPVDAVALGASSPLKVGLDDERAAPTGGPAESGAIHGDAAEAASGAVDHDSAGEKTEEGGAVTRRRKAVKGATKRGDAAGADDSAAGGAGEETAGAVPGAAKVRPEVSDETPWPMRERVAA